MAWHVGSHEDAPVQRHPTVLSFGLLLGCGFALVASGLVLAWLRGPTVSLGGALSDRLAAVVALCF
jgi:hypothetical protein